MICFSCDREVDAVVRCNLKGEPGLFACLDCRPKYPRALQNTADTLTLRDKIRDRTPLGF